MRTMSNQAGLFVFRVCVLITLSLATIACNGKQDEVMLEGSDNLRLPQWSFTEHNIPLAAGLTLNRLPKGWEVTASSLMSGASEVDGNRTGLTLWLKTDSNEVLLVRVYSEYTHTLQMYCRPYLEVALSTVLGRDPTEDEIDEVIEAYPNEYVLDKSIALLREGTYSYNDFDIVTSVAVHRCFKRYGAV